MRVLNTPFKMVIVFVNIKFMFKCQLIISNIIYEYIYINLFKLNIIIRNLIIFRE